MDQDKSRRLALAIFLVSLGWNALLIIFLLCIQDDVHLQKPFLVTLEDENQQQRKIDDDIFFADTLVSFGSSLIDKKLLLDPQHNIPVAKEEMTMAPQHPVQEEEPSEPPQPDETIQKEPIKDLIEKEEPTETITQEQDENSEPTEVEQPPEEHSTSEQPETTPTQIPETALKEPKHEVVIRQRTDPKQIKRNKEQRTADQKKKPLGLADIAKGYMRQVNQERENTVEHSLRSLPESKQMALYIYTTKMYDILEQTAKATQKMLYAPQNRTVDATLMVTINQDGELLEVQLIPQLHEKEVRDALLNIVNRAGLFPPIPKHLKKEKLTLSYPIKINMHQGFNTYSLGH